MMPPLPLVTLRQPTVLDRVSRAMAVLTLSLVAAVVLGFAVTVTYPWNPITKVEITVVGQSHVGGTLIVEVDYCKTRDWAPESVRWSLTNAVTVVLPMATTSLPPGCHVKRLIIQIPEHVAPGMYQLQEELRYEPWPWKSYTYIRQSPPFTLEGAHP